MIRYGLRAGKKPESSESQHITEQNGKENIAATELNNRVCTKCLFCGGTAIHMGGPIYVAPIHDPIFVQQLLNRFVIIFLILEKTK